MIDMQSEAPIIVSISDAIHSIYYVSQSPPRKLFD